MILIGKYKHVNVMVKCVFISLGANYTKTLVQVKDIMHPPVAHYTNTYCGLWKMMQLNDNHYT